jgi:hypothetical protein
LSLARLHATELQADLRNAVAKAGGGKTGRGKTARNNPGLSIESRAHLADSLGILTEALRATMQRS